METTIKPEVIIAEMKAVTSSQIESIGYDNKTETLAILFKSNRKTYPYYGVPKSVFDGFFSRPEVSIGQYFAANVREKFEYKAIN